MTRECRKYAGRIFRIQPVDVTYEKVEGGLDITGFLGTVAAALEVNPTHVCFRTSRNREKPERTPDDCHAVTLL